MAKLSINKACRGLVHTCVAAAAIAFISMTLSHKCIAANIQSFEYKGIGVVILDGEIAEGDSVKFIMQAHKYSSFVAVLNGPGGQLVAGVEIGKFIFSEKAATYIVDQCASACAYAWLGGRKRVLTLPARVGFHAAFSINEDGEVNVTSMGNALIGSYINWLGLSDEVLMYMTYPGPNTMAWIHGSKNDGPTGLAYLVESGNASIELYDAIVKHSSFRPRVTNISKEALSPKIKTKTKVVDRIPPSSPLPDLFADLPISQPPPVRPLPRLARPDRH